MTRVTIEYDLIEVREVLAAHVKSVHGFDAETRHVTVDDHKTFHVVIGKPGDVLVDKIDAPAEMEETAAGATSPTTELLDRMRPYTKAIEAVAKSMVPDTHGDPPKMTYRMAVALGRKIFDDINDLELLRSLFNVLGRRYPSHVWSVRVDNDGTQRLIVTPTGETS